MKREIKVEAEALLVTLAHTLAELQVEKFDDTVTDVEGIAQYAVKG